MRYFKNVDTERVLTEQEYYELLTRETIDDWIHDNNVTVEEFKEEGKTIGNYIQYIINEWSDNAFIECDELGNEIEM